jgi:hypothetical protein
MMELLNFEETKNLVYPLRYLLAAAYTTHPGEYLVKDLLVSGLSIAGFNHWFSLIFQVELANEVFQN